MRRALGDGTVLKRPGTALARTRPRDGATLWRRPLASAASGGRVYARSATVPGRP
ncbi:hypothetical protein [Actinomadura sp. CNU-125]|uniref:hypothetical protein n=1 Tax=Actinomadura sp. CNU-125 TaxID=1904961 RepID=UPI0013018896|nr:hypothetical protein [Actinomadura sp. CNU-125]